MSKKLTKGWNKFTKSVKKAGLDKAVLNATTRAAESAFTGGGAYGGMGAYAGMGSYKKKQKKKARKLARSILAAQSFSGKGAYVGNQLMVGSGKRPAKFRSVNDETSRMILSKREYIADIYAPPNANFTNAISFGVNPGLTGAFPWASQVASNFDKYKCRKVVAMFKPNVSEASTTGQAPSVMMAFVYNAAATPFLTKNQFLEYDGVVDGRVFDNMVCGMECDPAKIGNQWFFTRSGAVPSGQDIKMYDAAKFFLAINGSNTTNYPVGTILGELWVEYEFEVTAPKSFDSLGYSVGRDSFYCQTSLTFNLPTGTAPTKSISNSIGCTINKAVLGISGTWLTFPDNVTGYFRVTVNIACTVATGTLTAVSNAVQGVGAATQFFLIPGSGSGAGWTYSVNPNITFVQDMGEVSGANSSFIGVLNAAGTHASVDLFVQPATQSGANVIIICLGSLTATLTYLEVVEINPLNGAPISGGGVTSNYVPV